MKLRTVKYKICKNGEGKIKVKRKYPFTICWWDVEELVKTSMWSSSGKWQTKYFDSIKQAEQYIIKQQERQRISKKIKAKRNNWVCMGVY